MTKVLVAEDNVADRMLLARIVERHGYDVITAVDGLDALNKFASQEPDMVLLDAMMPEMDGFEVARAIKEEAGAKFIPIVFLSSLTDSKWLDECLRSGGDDFLSKPYNAGMLKAKLQALERLRGQQVLLERQRSELARLKNHLVQEQMAAKSVFDKIAHTGKLRGPYLKHLLSPLSVFNGDVLLAAHDPSGDLLVLLGDFTGHGLTAAIGALPLADIFYGMTAKGFAVSEILREANRKLKLVLPGGYFCCATVVRLSFRKKCIEYWNGGLPPGMLRRKDRRDVYWLESRHLPLGILEDAAFRGQTEMVEVEFGDRLVLCTDGVIEAEDHQGQQFTHERFEAAVRDADCERIFETVLEAVRAHTMDELLRDDLTLVEVDVRNLDAAGDESLHKEEINGVPQDWKLTYELGPKSLKVFNPLPMLQHVLMETPQLRSRASEIYTVLAETYANALEHGVMHLDSSLKGSADGFAQYYAQRAKALEHLDGRIRFDFISQLDAKGGTLTIRVTDSGEGFDFKRWMKRRRRTSSGYHGRGIMLLRNICDEVQFKAPGNTVEVKMRWGKADA
ncbi:MAG: fused response regulator/phosphatase [Pseudomonadales bacterium]